MYIYIYIIIEPGCGPMAALPLPPPTLPLPSPTLPLPPPTLPRRRFVGDQHFADVVRYDNDETMVCPRHQTDSTSSEESEEVVASTSYSVSLATDLFSVTCCFGGGGGDGGVSDGFGGGFGGGSGAPSACATSIVETLTMSSAQTSPPTSHVSMTFAR